MLCFILPNPFGFGVVYWTLLILTFIFYVLTILRSTHSPNDHKIEYTYSYSDSDNKAQTRSRLLFHCIIRGRFEIVQKLVFKYPELINEVDSENRNALHIAVLYKQYLCLSVLLRYDIPVDKVDIYGLSPIHYAAFNSDTTCFYLLTCSKHYHILDNIDIVYTMQSIKSILYTILPIYQYPEDQYYAYTNARFQSIPSLKDIIYYKPAMQSIVRNDSDKEKRIESACSTPEHMNETKKKIIYSNVSVNINLSHDYLSIDDSELDFSSQKHSAKKDSTFSAVKEHSLKSEQSSQMQIAKSVPKSESGTENERIPRFKPLSSSSGIVITPRINSSDEASLFHPIAPTESVFEPVEKLYNDGRRTVSPDTPRVESIMQDEDGSYMSGVSVVTFPNNEGGETVPPTGNAPYHSIVEARLPQIAYKGSMIEIDPECCSSSCHSCYLINENGSVVKGDETAPSTALVPNMKKIHPLDPHVNSDSEVSIFMETDPTEPTEPTELIELTERSENSSKEMIETTLNGKPGSKDEKRIFAPPPSIHTPTLLQEWIHQYGGDMCLRQPIIYTSTRHSHLCIFQDKLCSLTYCSHCSLFHSPCRFYCASCKQCVYGRMYHNRILNVCVGYQNYLYYLLLLITSNLLNVYGFVLSIGVTCHSIIHNSSLLGAFSLGISCIYAFFGYCNISDFLLCKATRIKRE